MKMTYVIGGHGDIVDVSSIDMTYAYLTQLKTGVAKMIEDGEGIDDAVNILTMDDFKNVGLYKDMHRQNVEIAYRMLEWGDE